MCTKTIVFGIAFLMFFLNGECTKIQNIKDNIPELLNFTIKEVTNPKNIIESFGYPAEEHKILTEDGYILVLHRIPRGVKGAKKRSPVLVMHGISSSSADFVNMGPKTSLGYLLADRGYDVWIGNARGNSYSNSHIFLDPNLNPEKFYNFSWHEIGTIDVPTKIDYILELTGQKKLHYIGHSQGGTVFYVMTSTKPEYNDKILLASLMAPAGFVTSMPPKIRFLSQYVTDIQYILEVLKIYHIPYLDLLRSFLQNVCKYENYFAVCKEIFYLFAGYRDDIQFNKLVFPKVFETTPSDASCRQFIHYFQEVKSEQKQPVAALKNHSRQMFHPLSLHRKFQHFDYGPKGNLKMYGTKNPSEYNLSAVTAPVALYYSKNDKLIGVKDIQRTAIKLPNVINNYLVPYDDFNHGDFLFANDVQALVYREMLRIMDIY